MKKLYVFFIILGITIPLSGQVVSNVVACQVGNTVEITYDLDEKASITLYLSCDGGKTYSEKNTAITGHIGNNTPAGHNKIVWNLLEDDSDWEIQSARFKVVAKDKPQKTFTINGVSFTMILVEGGTFTMGCTSEQGSDCYSDESPSHRVTLSDYFISQTEVTQGLWKAVMGSNPAWLPKGENYPVECVSWEDCQKFITKLNGLLSSQLGGKRFALPTEAQWEYAARGGHKMPAYQYKYSGSEALPKVAWYDDNSGRSTHPVATKTANSLGIYDMSGNVCEWCQDWYGSYSSSSQTNPSGPSSGSGRVGRGGSWDNSARNCRVLYRREFSPTDHIISVGFRLVVL